MLQICISVALQELQKLRSIETERLVSGFLRKTNVVTFFWRSPAATLPDLLLTFALAVILAHGIQTSINTVLRKMIWSAFCVLAPLCTALVTFVLIYKSTWKKIIRVPLNWLISQFYKRITSKEDRPGSCWQIIFLLLLLLLFRRKRVTMSARALPLQRCLQTISKRSLGLIDSKLTG